MESEADPLAPRATSDFSSSLLNVIRSVRRRVANLCASRRVPLPDGTSFLGPPPLPPRRSCLSGLPSPQDDTAVTEDAASTTGADAEPAVTAEVVAAEALAAATQAVKLAENKVKNLRKQLKDPAVASKSRREGRAILMVSEDCWCSVASGDSVDLPDPDGGDERLVFKLPKPGKSREENSEALVAQAEKVERANSRCSDLIADAEGEARRWSDAAESLERLRPWADAVAQAAATELHKELRDAGHIKAPSKEPLTSAAEAEALQRRKYGKEIDCFVSPSGHEVIAGRSAAANERVSFELTPEDAFWFHSDGGVPGSHVAILCSAKDVATMEDVEFAAAIAAWHSKARNHEFAGVCYAHGGQLSRPRIPKLGQVRILGKRGKLSVKPALPEG
eukprot:TRINITY_DN24832_c0_g1_i1.p1 TRINITY_DN24832_c0_g1~~TRINITY_DN24832_c0_g1_i1.p1  ORF type:complete len:418 (-),score=74.59 TRINITY_DN24832_c0_g1_i1:11-1186(-)